VRESKEEKKNGGVNFNTPEILNYTQHVSIPQVICEEVQENGEVLPDHGAPSWGCWGCVEGAVHEVMVVTQVGPETEGKKQTVRDITLDIPLNMCLLW